MKIDKKLAIILYLITSLAMYAYSEELIPFQDPKTELYGFKNNKNKIIIPAEFVNVGKSEEGEKLIPVVKNNKFYRIDSKGKLKFESVFFDNGWDYYEEGLARFIGNDKIGFHNKKGTVIISPKYDFATSFNKGYSIVCIGCWEYYPKSPKFKPLHNGVYIEHAFTEITGGKWGAINNLGQIIIPLKYNSIEEVEKRKDFAPSVHH